MVKNILLALTVATVILWQSDGANADAIDGGWCHEKSGKRLNIDGPAIVTPGGNRIQGDNQHHTFSYKIPAGEPGAGGRVD
ncbi:MAG: hypothetical protein HQ503_04605, partial [Rhodospirillales bacterium]|nr:hypothetical protein [Rhodospirillales bacterium]